MDVKLGVTLRRAGRSWGQIARQLGVEVRTAFVVISAEIERQERQQFAPSQMAKFRVYPDHPGSET